MTLARSVRCVGSAAVAVLMLLSAAAPAAGQQYPTLTQPVNDFAGVIDAASAAELDRQIRALDAATQDAVVVVTIKTFAPAGSIEDYAVELFERAGIGRQGRDNGVLVLLSLDERRVRIEVGYELEQFITDGFAGEVIRRQMLPSFRSGRYGPGLVAGVTGLIARIAEGRNVALAASPAPVAREVRRSPSRAAVLIVIVLILLVVLISRIARRAVQPLGGRRRQWGRSKWSGWGSGVGGFGGGSFGGFGGGFGGGRRGGGFGGFGGFGGGRSGGGGASGGW